MPTLLSLVIVAVVASAPDSFAMQQIAWIPLYIGAPCPCGDADHDGRQEMYLGRYDDGTYAVEHLGNNQFDTTQLFLWPRGVVLAGDTDKDGLADHVVQHETRVELWESRDSFSYPDTLVWRLPDSITRGNSPFVMDLDCDSALEIAVMTDMSRGRAVYECDGDNAYELRGFLVPDPPGRGAGQQGAFCRDLDRDGRPEFATAGECWLSVFESPANDSFECVAVLDLTAPYNGDIYGVGTAEDMDGNGRDELIAFSSCYDSYVWVFESPADDSFEVVWRREVTSGSGMIYGGSVAVGDIEGDGRQEFAVATCDSVYLFRWQDGYQLVWEMPSIWRGVRLYDINSDGRDELICTTDHSTTIFEWLPVSIAEQERRRLEAVTLEPSVVRAGASVRLSGLPEGASVNVLDVSGRVVRADEGETISTRGLRPGTYFLRVESGPHSIRRKFLVAG